MGEDEGKRGEGGGQEGGGAQGCQQEPSYIQAAVALSKQIESDWSVLYWDGRDSGTDGWCRLYC